MPPAAREREATHREVAPPPARRRSAVSLRQCACCPTFPYSSSLTSYLLPPTSNLPGPVRRLPDFSELLRPPPAPRLTRTLPIWQVRLLPDFSELLPADYRQRYGAWRSGSAVGAKGETGAAAATAADKLPRQAWVQEISTIADVSWSQRVFA